MTLSLHRRIRFLGCVLLVAVSSSTPAAAIDAPTRAAAEESIRRGLAYLASTQNGDGIWSPEPGPAITGLVLRACFSELKSGRETDEPALGIMTSTALFYVLDHVQPDGSIRSEPDGILANYNTAICVSALSETLHLDSVQTPRDATRQRIRDAIQRGTAFLRGLQWQDGMTDADGRAVDQDHAFYGGAGYGKHGRPDLSNTQTMLQALRDAGLPADDPAYQRALTFITRLQGTAANDFYPEGTIVQDGGAIYATSVNGDLVGVPQSMANPEMIDEARAGRPVSGLRGYGSMTYAAFKSYLYADLKPDDQRVHDALRWIAANYTLDRNPGMPPELDQQGLFYYYLTHARALAAFGRPTINTTGGEVDWAANLIEALVARQQPDGSWANPSDRWMEGDPNLATAYAVLAMQEALGDAE